MTPFRYSSRECGNIITVYAPTQDEADAILLSNFPTIKFMDHNKITYEFEVVDHFPAARVYVNGCKHTAYYTLDTRNNRPVWCPEHVWQKALDYDNKTMF